MRKNLTTCGREFRITKYPVPTGCSTQKDASLMTEIASGGLRLPQKLYKILKRFSRKRRSPQWLVQRSQIILLRAKGNNLTEIARQLGIDRKTARLWSQRWKEGLKILSISMADASPKSLEKRIKIRHEGCTTLTQLPLSSVLNKSLT